jgi:hypothetical protein
MRVVGGTVRIVDNAGVFDPDSSDDCAPVSRAESSCALSAVKRITGFSAGGNDNWLAGTELPTQIDGGDGDDTYAGGLGGPRTSRVGFSGGSGRDRVQYVGADRGVSITKDRGDNDGRVGIDRDNIGPDVEELMGSQFGDSLNGSPGSFNERFFGLGGDDVMTGGPGFDVFAMGAQADGADRIFGGADADTVEYDQRTRSVTVNLSDGGADDGEAGERDELRELESARTGSGNDTLKVNAASTSGVFLHSGGGGDTITGTNAADTIVALGGGRDTIDARDGADVINTRDDQDDRVACGAGIDTITADSTNLDVQAGCERVQDVGVLAVNPKATTAKAGDVARLGLSWRHPQNWSRLRHVTLRLSDDGVAVGQITVTPRTGRMTDDGAVALVRGASRVERAGKTVRAKLGVELDASLAGRRLTIDVEATDVRGRRQIERDAGALRVAE